METQTNITPAPEGSSGVNTVLLVIIILAIAGFGFWWYRYYRAPAPAPANNTLKVDVTLPKDSGTTGGGTSAPAY